MRSFGKSVGRTDAARNWSVPGITQVSKKRMCRSRQTAPKMPMSQTEPRTNPFTDGIVSNASRDGQREHDFCAGHSPVLLDVARRGGPAVGLHDAPDQG